MEVNNLYLTAERETHMLITIFFSTLHMFTHVTCLLYLPSYYLSSYIDERRKAASQLADSQ